MRRFVYFGNLEARLEGRLERLRKICDVVLVRSQRLITCIGLLVEVACHKQRLPAHCLICGLRCQALILPGGVRQLAALPVGACNQSGGLARHFVLGVGAAKSFEHTRGGLPVLQLNQRAACVVLSRCADCGSRRCRANPQEVIGGGAIVLRVSCNLTLLVDGGCQVVNKLGVRRVALRRDRQHLRVAFFGLRVRGEFERTVRNHNPCGASDAHLRARIFINNTLGGAHGGAKVLHLVLVIGGRSQDRCGLCVGRERVSKFDRACDRIVLDGVQILLG